MATVKALYDYSYDYEGTNITIRIGEAFQLLAKANNDWWHVRRWTDGIAQDLYVPAVYVKEEEQTTQPENPTYENVADIIKKMKEKREKKVNGSSAVPESVVPKTTRSPSLKDQQLPDSPKHTGPSCSPKPSPKHKPKKHKPSNLPSTDNELVKVNGQPKSTPEHAIPIIRGSRESSPVPPQSPVAKLSASKGIKDGWLPGYALPVISKARSKSVNTEAASIANRSSTSPTETTPRTTSPTGKGPAGSAKARLPPPVLPKSKYQRPRSMIVTTSPSDSLYENPEETFSSFIASAPKAKAGPPNEYDALLPAAETTPSALKLRRTSSPPQILQQKASSLQNGGSLPRNPTTTTGGSLPRNPTTTNGGSLPRNPTTTTTTTTTPATPPPLPDGWTEHRTNTGQTYYHNATTGDSSWVRPQSDGSTNKSLLEKVAPCGWTKEANTFTQTPIFTNCRTGERWALARDGAGNVYYYNLANSSLTIGELPEITDDIPVNRSVSEPVGGHDNIYAEINPPTSSPPNSEPHPPPLPRPRAGSDSRTLETSPPTSPRFHMQRASVDIFASSLSNVLVQKKHGYFQRKRLYDAQGKKAKGGWQKMYVVLQDHHLHFYTDHKAAKDVPGAKPLSIFSLLQATVSSYTKEKKRNVFQVSSSLGEQFLLQTDTSPQMNDWYSTIQNTIDKANMEFQQHPERYRGMEASTDDRGDASPKLPKTPVRKASTVDDEEGDPMDDPEISAADKSVRIRSRLKKLMARRPQLETLKKSGIIEDSVFGCELGKLCEREKSNVPKFLVQFMDHIEKQGLESVGIYRLSGNAASVQKLRFLVEASEYEPNHKINLDAAEWSDINIVSGCLKLYLRELPDPLIPLKRYKGFIEAARLGSQQQRIAGIAARVRELPTANYCTLKALIEHLRRVIEHGNVNKMQAQNVAIVFGPTLMDSGVESFEMATLMPVQNGVIEVMLNEYDSIFRK